MTDLAPIPLSGRALELPDVCMATEEGWGLASLVLGAMLLGAQAMLPALPAARDARVAVSGAAATTAEESDPVRDPVL